MAVVMTRKRDLECMVSAEGLFAVMAWARQEYLLVEFLDDGVLVCLRVWCRAVGLTTRTVCSNCLELARDQTWYNTVVSNDLLVYENS